MWIEQLLLLTILAIPSASVAVTISWSKFFKKLRVHLDENGPEFLADLIYCHYCLGHWTALFFFILVRPFAITTGFIITDFVVNIFYLIGLTNILSTFMMLAIHKYLDMANPNK